MLLLLKNVETLYYNYISIREMSRVQIENNCLQFWEKLTVIYCVLALYTISRWVSVRILLRHENTKKKTDSNPPRTIQLVLLRFWLISSLYANLCKTHDEGKQIHDIIKNGFSGVVYPLCVAGYGNKCHFYQYFN